MIDPHLFTVESLLKALLDDAYGNRDMWRQLAEIIPNYFPPSPRPEVEVQQVLPELQPKCVVRVGSSFLRYSKGPRQGFFWDLYGDDFQTPELALLALLQAPVPPMP